MRYKIAVPSFNCADALERCLNSLAGQTFRDFDCCVVDDASTDPRHGEVMRRLCNEQQWLAVRHEENRGALAAMQTAIDCLNCDDDDVIIELDGDDQLYNERVLEYVAQVQEEEKPLFAFGQQLSLRSGRVGPARHVRSRIVRRKSFRKEPFIFCHLRVFHYRLWRQIRPEDLHDAAGKPLRAGWDTSAMWAMAEMAGPRIRYMPHVLYVYNDENPISDRYAHLDEQRAVEMWARKLKPYKTLKR